MDDKRVRDIKIIRILNSGKFLARKMKYLCKGCGRKVTYSDNLNNKCYCNKCHDIAFKQKKDPKVSLKCIVCKKLFHPPRNWKSPSIKYKGFYCSPECYFSAIKKGRKLHIFPIKPLIENAIEKKTY